MTHRTSDQATSGLLTWTSVSANMPSIGDEEVGDVDEPPDPCQASIAAPETPFRRTFIRKVTETPSSLLTKALRQSPEEDLADACSSALERHRRRSMASNISLASTVELTSDTGPTSPSRANTPSPPLPEIKHLRLDDGPLREVKAPANSPQKVGDVVDGAPRKRCITFACAAKPFTAAPEVHQPTRPALAAKAPSAQEAPRRPCIKFTCPIRPCSTQNTPPMRSDAKTGTASRPLLSTKEASPSTRKPRNLSNQGRSPRPSHSRRTSEKGAVKQSKSYITADAQDLLSDSSRFHEFASDEPHEDDWIRQEASSTKCKLTIDDTLIKENRIRRLGKEAEEEAEQEERDEEDAAANDDDDDDDELDMVYKGGRDDDDDDDDDEDDEDDEDSDEAGDSDGYHTDEETGFADSDEDEDDGLTLWTPGRTVNRRHSIQLGVTRPSSDGDQHSDSSSASKERRRRRSSRKEPKYVPIRPGTPELPDSTDFVCGTFDEDKPMEKAYISCLAARKQMNLHLIPQDIDPSFPASEPEGDGEDMFNPVHHDTDEHLWLHGEMEDLHHEQDRHGRRKSKGGHRSPKRYHSPPPKRHHSPAPKLRGRSPRGYLDRHASARTRSPDATATSSQVSPTQETPTIRFGGLAPPVGFTQTKSLPRPPAMFPHAKHGRRGKANSSDIHVRGAIDIVKGLERKRQRRREKFFQKYCNRARKGQIPERKTQKGQGAERMRELGLLMAGKTGHGNYVLSV